MDMAKNSDIRQTLSQTKAEVDTIKEKKIVIFGHICRMQVDRFIKTVMLGETEDGKTKTRESKEKMIG